MKQLVRSLCLVLAGVAPAAADANHNTAAPGSLRMRPRATWSPLRAAKRVAQATPDPPAPSGDPPAPPPADQAPATPPPDQAPAPPPAEPAPATAPADQAPATAPAAPASPAPAAPAAPSGSLSDQELAQLAEQEAKTTEVINVTGSLIGRKEVDSPSPVSVLDKEKLEAAGLTNPGDILQRIPAQGNAINAQNNNGGDGSVRIDLRSLGTARTLVLMNGRRIVPSGTGADASVDLGTIPLAMIERIEVLKDGASAIYGSDAVAGVVNIITRTDFNGTEATAYGGTSQRGDGSTYDLSLVSGQSSQHGNITFAIGYQQQKSVLAADRNFSKQVYAYDFGCTSALQAAGECTQRVLSGSPASAGGRINTANAGTPLTVPGCTSQFCTADGAGGFRNFIAPTETSLGDNYNFQPLNYLLTPSKRLNLFATGHHDLTDDVSVFFEAMYNRRTSNQQLAEEPLSTAQTGTPISAQSIYNPFGRDVVDYSRRLVEFGPRTFEQETSTSRVVVGLNGKFGDDLDFLSSWKWEASFDYGRNDATQSSRGDLILSHLANALGPSYVDPALGPQCGTPTAPVPGCVPLSILTPGQVTPGMINYLTFTGIQNGFNEQRTTTLQAHGKVVDLPNHGDVSAAIGGDYRHEQGGVQPDPLTSTGDTTGNVTRPTEGTYHAFEGYGELSVVPVSGLDYLKWVELDAAGRAYDYSTFGSGTTGKLSALVRTAGGLALRGTYGTAFRAPNISELFSGQADSFPLIEDPCDVQPPSAGGRITLDPKTAAECAREGVPANTAFGTSQQRSTIGGNKRLTPETATVGTAGVVFEPVKGLDLTLDYWHIKIDNAITTLQVATILAQCYQGGQMAFCDQIQRDPVTHSISHLLDLTQNVGSIETSGLDFSANYQYQTDLGTLRHSLEGTYLFKYNLDTGTVDPATGREQIIHGRSFYDLGVLPDLKLNLFTTWQHPSGLGAGVNVRFVDGFQECDNNNCNDPSNGRRDVDSYLAADLFVTYTLKTGAGTTRVALGINNLSDASPPAIYNGQALNTDESQYDFLGRFFYLRVGQLF